MKDQTRSEYESSLSYLDELKKVYDEKGNLVKNKEREANVIPVWKDLITKAASISHDEDEAYLCVARDFQRFFTCFKKYSGTLEKMWATDDEGIKSMVRKITNLTFFGKLYKDDSDDFFKLRKWAKELPDKELSRKINSHLDCIITGLFRQLKRRYGSAG